MQSRYTILKKEFNILKKPYLAPRIEFEEIEADEREMLMVSMNSGGGAHQGSGDSTTEPGEGEEDKFEGQSLDLDFVINDF